MSRLQTRLRKLEAHITDHKGLIPHTPPWLEYWVAQMDKLVAGEPMEERIPLEAFDAIMTEED